jgi:VWFA-related protein
MNLKRNVVAVILMCVSDLLTHHSGNAQCMSAKDAGNSQMTLHTSARSVLADVVIPEKAAGAMRETSFQVFEDGRRQRVTSFTFHDSLPGGLLSPASPSPFDPVGAERSNLHAVTRTIPVTMILLDTLNTSIVDQQRGRKQIIAALRFLPPGQSVALFILGNTLQMIQSFTERSDVLIAAAGRMNARISPLYVEHGANQVSEDDSLSGADFQKENKAHMFSAIRDPGEKSRVASEEIEKALAERGTRRVDQRIEMTFSEIARLAQTVQDYPGRKKLIWITGSLPLVLRPDAGSGYDPDLVRNYGLKLHALEAALANAQIAVYTMDARGLITLGMDASKSASDAAGMQPGQESSNLYQDREEDSLHITQATLQEIAENTGGRSFLNQNNLAPGMREAMLDGSSYYSLSYQPASIASDGKYHSIEIRIDGIKGSRLQYRRGYYALAETSKDPEKTKELFVAAMQRGAPIAGGITFKATLSHLSPGLETTVDYVIDTSSLSLKDGPDCSKKINLVIGAVAWKDSVLKVETGFKIFDQSLTQEEFRIAQLRGLRVRQTLAESSGQTFYKLGVMDLTTGRLGTLDYPLQDP